MPHGTIRSKYERSVDTLRAKPCQVTQSRAWTPIDAILRRLGPDARVADVPLRGDAQLRQGLDEALLDLPEVPVQVLAVPLEIDDRVADELAGPVKRHVPAALDLEQLDAALRQERRRREQMPLLARAPQRHDRGMLDEQKHVLVDRARDSSARQAPL